MDNVEEVANLSQMFISIGCPQWSVCLLFIGLHIMPCHEHDFSWSCDAKNQQTRYYHKWTLYVLVFFKAWISNVCHFPLLGVMISKIVKRYTAIFHIYQILWWKGRISSLVGHHLLLWIPSSSIIYLHSLIVHVVSAAIEYTANYCHQISSLSLQENQHKCKFSGHQCEYRYKYWISYYCIGPL